MADKKRTFQERVELRVNTVLIALDRLSKISSGENVVPNGAVSEIGAVLRPALDKALSGLATSDRKASGLKLKAKF